MMRFSTLISLTAAGLAFAPLVHSETVPVLPATPHNYADVELPEHYLVNAIPSNSPFQSAAIANDNTPADNPTTDDGATLGRVLFYDRTLSANGTVACASCHEQANGFSDDRQLSLGFAGGETRRHSMSLTNARFYEPGHFFWDERADTLEDQVLMPFQDATEMGLTLDQLVSLVAGQPYYAELFTHAFGDAVVTSDRIARALAQFVRSMVSVDSRYDQGRALVDDPLDPFPNFTNEENLGKRIFMDRTLRPVTCIDCHVTEAFISPPRGTPHDTGTTATTNNGLDRVSTTDLGVAETTGNVDDTGHFKVPSLRNVAVTAPFMHDGRFATLREVMDFYARDIEAHAQLSDILVTPGGNAARIPLNNNDRNALVAFLNTLTDETLLTDDKFSDPFVEVTPPEPEPDPTPEPAEPEVDPEPDLTPIAFTRHQLINTAARARVVAGTEVLIAGFVVTGDTPKTLLVRGIGPGLVPHGVTDALANPVLRVFAGSELVATNDNWSAPDDAADVATAAARVGAFALAPGSLDSALLVTLPAGTYTAHLDAANGGAGTGLVEIYDTTPSTTAEVVNLSTHARLAPGDDLLIPSFVVGGETPRRCLIRAIGPGLTALDVPDALADPRFTVFDAEGRLVTANNNWSAAGNALQTAALTDRVGAFALTPGSRDAATTIALAPGPYTIHVQSADGGGGTVLVEIYTAPVE